MIGRLKWLMIFLLLALASHVEAQSNEAPFSKIDASVELHGEAPYVGEPLRLVIRSAIHAQVANDRDWMGQLKPVLARAKLHAW